MSFLLLSTDAQSSHRIGLKNRRARLRQRLLGQKKCTGRIGGGFSGLIDMLRTIGSGGQSRAVATTAVSTPTAAPAASRNPPAFIPDKKGPRTKRSKLKGKEGLSSWACPGCTLLNSPQYWKCTLCHTDRVVLHSPTISVTPPVSTRVCSVEYIEISDDNDDAFESPTRRHPPMQTSRRRAGHKQQSADHRPAIVGAALLGERVKKKSSINVAPSPVPSQLSQPSSSPLSLAVETLTPLQDSFPRPCTAYINSPLPTSRIQHLMFNGLPLPRMHTAEGFRRLVPTLDAAGRRLGNVRPGKNKLIGKSETLLIGKFACNGYGSDVLCRSVWRCCECGTAGDADNGGAI